MTSKLITTALTGFVGGVAVQDVLHANAAFAAFLLLLAVSIFLFVKTTPKPYFGVVLVGVLLLGATLGSVRMELAQAHDAALRHALDAGLGTEVTLVGVVDDEPDVRESSTNVGVELLNTGQRVLVRASAYQQVQYGDVVQVRGTLARPENFTSDAGKTFDYIAYLAKDDIHYLIEWGSIQVVASGAGNPIKAWLFASKQRYVAALSEVMPEPEAGLAGGITVGTKQALGGELLESFRRTGLVHIVVLSGFNVTIIILFLLRILSRLPRPVQYTVAAVSVILFTILTGADAPVMRASIMGLLGVLALTVRRTYNITRALLLVGVGMVAWNPEILLHDIAFQLSFVATLGLIYLSPLIAKYIGERLPKLLTEIVAATVATQIAVLPLLIYYMGEVSIVSVVVNVLTLPTIPLAMLLSFLAGSVGMVSTTLAVPFAYATYAVLHYVVGVVRIFDALPFTTVTF